MYMQISPLTTRLIWPNSPQCPWQRVNVDADVTGWTFDVTGRTFDVSEVECAVRCQG